MSTTPDQRGGVSRVRRGGGGGGRASTVSPLKGRILNNNNNNTEDAKSTSMARLYQGILQLRKFRSKAKDEHLPHHHHLQKDNVHIQVPLRMMLSTLSIFLIFPLALFGWRQFHPTVRADRIVESAPKNASSQVLDRFPTWMDEIKLPPLVSEEGTTNNETSVLPENVDPDDSPQEANDPVPDATESIILTSDTEVSLHSSEKETPGKEFEEEPEVEQIEEDEQEEVEEDTSD